MATRSTIAIKLLSGAVRQIYCHWDGYLEHNGTILKTYYKTPEQVKQLISHGDLSSLGERVDPINMNHSFDEAERGTCVYYGRDRGETGVDASDYSSMNEFRSSGRSEEFDYLYDEETQRWYLLTDYLNKLKEFLPELDTVISVTKPTNLMDFIEYYKQQQNDLRWEGETDQAELLREVISDLEKILGFA